MFLGDTLPIVRYDRDMWLLRAPVECSSWKYDSDNLREFSLV